METRDEKASSSNGVQADEAVTEADKVLVDDNDDQLRWFVEEDVAALQALEADLSAEQIQELLESATRLKEAGNVCFREKRFSDACDTYTKALRECLSLSETAELRAILRCNRAACFAKLEKCELAIDDCTHALALNERYEKALLRRAQLYELNDDTYEKAADDYEMVKRINPDCAQAVAASQILAQKVQDRNERMKNEMFGKLKDLGNLVLKPFGLSTENFKLEPQEGGGYSVKLERNQ